MNFALELFLISCAMIFSIVIVAEVVRKLLKKFGETDNGSN